uniref:Uncharacterized protein n=1 Tax=Ciona savignyi TaxID=51511 RepID=H2YY48_CIOSA
MSVSRLLKAANSINRRNFSNDAKLWNLMSYRFFVPLQTRWRDTTGNGNLIDSVYYDTMISVAQSFVSKFYDEKDTSHILTDNNYECREGINYPETPLAGLGVTEVTGSRLKFAVGFFKPKTDLVEVDPTSIVNLNLHGNLLQADDVRKIADHYDNEAAVLGYQATVIKSAAAEGIPLALEEGLKLIFINGEYPANTIVNNSRNL